MSAVLGNSAHLLDVTREERPRYRRGRVSSVLAGARPHAPKAERPLRSRGLGVFAAEAPPTLWNSAH